MRRAALLVALALSCTACGDEPVSEPRPAREEDVPRGPAGQAEVRCTGASIDPPELELVAARADADLLGTLSALEAIVGRHAGSSTARVRLGELALRTDPPRAEAAARWLERALALHDEGCTLGERDHWAALEGSALARMMQRDYAGALPFLRQSLQRWSSVRSTRYNLACALCQTGDLDGCERELTAVLGATEPMPAFLADATRPPGHFRTMAGQDPDLAPLRADAARFERVLRADPSAP